MARNLLLTRTEADLLLDLLEEKKPIGPLDWRRTLANEIRQAFGYCSLEETERRIEAGPTFVHPHEHQK